MEKMTIRTKEYFQNEWKLWSSRRFLYSALISFFILYVSSLINTVAGMAATQSAGSPVTDIVLSNLARIDTSFIHADVTGYVRDLTLILLFLMPRYLPFGMKAIALLTVVRGAFINMTHLGIYPDAIPITSLATFGGDLFFSGHVGASIIAALIFWAIKPLRYFFFLTAVVFGAGALLGHYHYTIDVFAAPFIAYGVFVIANKLFPDDVTLLNTGKYPQEAGTEGREEC